MRVISLMMLCRGFIYDHLGTLRVDTSELMQVGGPLTCATREEGLGVFSSRRYGPDAFRQITTTISSCKIQLIPNIQQYEPIS